VLTNQRELNELVPIIQHPPSIRILCSIGHLDPTVNKLLQISEMTIVITAIIRTTAMVSPEITTPIHKKYALDADNLDTE
jgi:hypothetical protein